jgi:hypothetical protein
MWFAFDHGETNVKSSLHSLLRVLPQRRATVLFMPKRLLYTGGIAIWRWWKLSGRRRESTHHTNLRKIVQSVLLEHPIHNLSYTVLFTHLHPDSTISKKENSPGWPYLYRGEIFSHSASLCTLCIQIIGTQRKAQVRPPSSIFKQFEPLTEPQHYLRWTWVCCAVILRDFSSG